MVSPEKSWVERIGSFLRSMLEFIWYFIKLSAAFLLFSLPVITVFAAYGAAIDCISETQRSGLSPVFRSFWRFFKTDGLRSSAAGAICSFAGLVLYVSGTYYYYLTAGSAVQYLSVIVFAVLAFVNFSFFVCFFCINSLVDLPLWGLLSNTVRYVLISIPTNIGLLLTLCTVALLICLKPFLCVLFPLLLSLLGWLALASHKRGILLHMIADE